MLVHQRVNVPKNISLFRLLQAEWRTRITKTLVEACDNGLLAQVLAELKGPEDRRIFIVDS